MSEKSALHAVTNTVYERHLDEGNPAGRPIPGLDSEGALLELVLLVFDSGSELIMHAMPACKQYLRLLTNVGLF